MSVLLNLLPDLRQAKLREQRRRQMAVGISVLVWAACAGVVLVLFLFSAGQAVQIAVHSHNIDDTKTKLQSVSGLTGALTAAQHLNALPELYANRVLFTKFFGAYQDADPLDVTLSSLHVNEANVLTVNGVSKSYAALAKLQRAMELSNVSVGQRASAQNTPYFSNVSLDSAVNTTGKGINFTLSAQVSSEALHAKQ
ncbi:MAG TPA: PilN domain-containing protein [Candidatus Saccharimonadia bacterium]